MLSVLSLLRPACFLSPALRVVALQAIPRRTLSLFGVLLLGV